VTPFHHQPEAQHPKIFQLSTSRRPITPSFGPKPDILIAWANVRFPGVKRTLTTRVGRTPRASARIAPGAPHLD
jgi:hypothetical protein